MKNTKYTLLFMSSDNPRNKTIDFGRKTFLFLISFLLIAFIGFVIYNMIYIPKVIEYKNSQNSITIDEKNKKYQQLLKDFARMRAMNDYVQNIVGISEEGNAGIDSLIINDTNSVDDFQNNIVSIYNIPTNAPASGMIVQEYRDDNIFGNKSHTGIDISGKKGDPIVASANGLVVFSGWTDDLGNLIIIVHDNKFVTVYGHNSKNIVSERQFVTKGQLIALMGSSGYSSGTHLHFEIWEYSEAKDPREFIVEYQKEKEKEK